MFIIGSNPSEAHPVFSTIMKRGKANGAKLIVADPREIELAKIADVYLPVKPGTNVTLVNAMCNIIYNEGLIDEDYIKERTDGFEEFTKVIQDYTPERAAEVCEVDVDLIYKAARTYAEAGCAGIFYCLGVTEHRTGTKTVFSLSNLALMTGNIGKESAGVNPIRGQNNVQGACDMGALPSDYPGYQKVIKPEIKEKFEKAWGVELSDEIGYTSTEVIPAAVSGAVKGLYIMGENQMLSDPNQGLVKKGLENLDFLVVQDIFLTETAELADVVLPATTYAEKNGSFTNSERRVQLIRKAIEPLEGTRTDIDIITDIARRMGYYMKYDSYEEAFDEMASLTPSYSGMSYPKMEAHGLQWPCNDMFPEGTKYLHKDVMAGGVGHFMGQEDIGPGEKPDEEYPYILSTGRNLYQYNVRNMTGRTEGIEKKAGWSYIEMSPETASSLNMEDGEMIEVTSRRGSIHSHVRVRDGIRNDTMYMPFHYIEGAANVLTSDYLCPIAKTPEYKVSAIKVNKL